MVTNADVLTVKITIIGLKITKVTVCITYSSNCSLHLARNSDGIVNSRTLYELSNDIVPLCALSGVLPVNDGYLGFVVQSGSGGAT